MDSNTSPALLRAALNLSIPCLLVSFFSLSLLNEANPLLRELVDDDMFPLLTIALGNGLLVGFASALFKHHLRSRQQRGEGLFPTLKIRREDIYAAGTVGFCCGALSIFLVISGIGFFLLTLLTLWLVGVHIKRFGRSAVDMLRPERIPTWDEVGRLAYIYVLLVTAFTLINASLDMACELLAFPRPFEFGHGPGLLIDALYFTVVLLTTVGFGDFHPLTTLGKIFVTIECLTGYVIFALLIGIVTSGVTNARSRRTPPE